jgi:hypothetical protein
MAVVREGAESADNGRNTDSTAKKHPDIAALNPAISMQTSLN